MCLTGLASCAKTGPRTTQSSALSDWIIKATRRLAAHELWKEHDGGDQTYIQRGCLSETISDYRHRSRPWTIRCSVFDQSKPDGARSLFEYFHEGVEDEIRAVEPVGDAMYLWKSTEMRAWLIGFCKGRFFVEISLTEEGNPNAPMTESARDALIAFARSLAANL